MTYVASKLYGYHVANLREIEAALTFISREARALVSTQDPQNNLRSLLRLYSFLIGAWAETRLNKLLNEPNGFNETEQQAILSKEKQFERWQQTIDSAFRKRYGITRARLGISSLGIDASARRDALHEALKEHLSIVIEIRNKLAHGQWLYPLNNEGKKVETKKFTLINNENIMSLQFKFSIIKHLADAINDLVVSPAAFQRDFDSHYTKFYNAKRSLERDYETYKADLINRRRAARRASTSTGTG